MGLPKEKCKELQSSPYFDMDNYYKTALLQKISEFEIFHLQCITFQGHNNLKIHKLQYPHYN